MLCVHTGDYSTDWRNLGMDIFVCIGSSCHLKGAYNIINALKDELAGRHLEDRINLSASFCLGHCEDGVSMKINDRIVTGFTAENIRERFENEIMKELEP